MYVVHGEKPAVVICRPLRELPSVIRQRVLQGIITFDSVLSMRRAWATNGKSASLVPSVYHYSDILGVRLDRRVVQHEAGEVKRIAAISELYCIIIDGSWASPTEHQSHCSVTTFGTHQPGRLSQVFMVRLV